MIILSNLDRAIAYLNKKDTTVDIIPASKAGIFEVPIPERLSMCPMKSICDCPTIADCLPIHEPQFYYEGCFGI